MPSARSRHKPRPPTGARSPTGSEPKRRGRAPARHRGAHLVARQAGKQRGRTKPQRLRFSSSSTGARQQPNALRADPPARRQPPTGARVPENQQITPVDRRSAQNRAHRSRSAALRRVLASDPVAKIGANSVRNQRTEPLTFMRRPLQEPQGGRCGRLLKCRGESQGSCLRPVTGTHRRTGLTADSSPRTAVCLCSAAAACRNGFGY